MRASNLLTVFMFTGVFMAAATSLTTGNRTDKTQKAELSRESRALPLVPIVLKLALGGATAAASYCAAQPMCCVSSLINVAKLSDDILNGIMKAIKFFNAFG
ncbi:unnamed protein product [Lymnaea stagnalis]|uniref:Hydrophobin n=1 Tax=Lymnaea stagnalis TaxID=6523 RepID=A0AAV2HZU3_LYMST